MLRCAALFIIACIPSLVGVQGSQGAPDFLDRKVRNFHPVSGPINHVLEDLALTYRLHIGIEMDLRKLTAPEIITIRIKEESLRTTLNEIMKADPTYTWKELDGVINVFPKCCSDSILDTEVPGFVVRNATRDQLTDRIAELAEVKLAFQALGVVRSEIDSMPNERQPSPSITLDLKRVRLRTILNESMKQSLSAYWVLGRYGERREYFSLSLGG